jgi:hypothetical protein
MTTEQCAYGSAEHAAAEALNLSMSAHDGYVSTDVETVARVVVEGLRERGFTVSREPRCEWYAVDGNEIIYCDLRGVHGHNGDPPTAKIPSEEAT